MDTIPWSSHLSSVSLRPCRPFLPDPASQSGGRAQARSVVATAKTPARLPLHRKPLPHLLVPQDGAFATTRIFSLTQATITFIAPRSPQPSPHPLPPHTSPSTP